MSTQHPLITKSKIEMEIDERSSDLFLLIWDNTGNLLAKVSITPEELAGLGERCREVAYYHRPHN